MVRLLLGVIVVGLLCAARAGHAQECAAAPDLYPADGSAGLPLDGVVRVVFHEPYELDGPVDEALQLFADETSEQIAGAVEVQPQGLDTRVELRTDQPLAESTSYRATVRLPSIQGETTFFFRTGSLRTDTSPPDFDGASSILVVPADDLPCEESTEVEEDEPARGYRVTVSFPPAIDDAGPANLDYVLYQTVGPDLELPVERKRVRSFGSSPFGAVFLPKEAVDNQSICFEVHAVDMFGNVADPSREACGDPVGPGQFRSMCTIAQGAPPVARDGALGLAALCLAIVFVRTRRTRSS